MPHRLQHPWSDSHLRFLVSCWRKDRYVDPTKIKRRKPRVPYPVKEVEKILRRYGVDPYTLLVCLLMAEERAHA